ncbi:glycosyltransferase family 1 protein [Aliivibrio finisterrensis]|uniref:Glycosyltransferase family 1 protein n=1 Tax=Aliivibrio finisterrensis TaxID=511998 RepID=A0A4Q5KDC3_9GAMM|nr:glycosyltransferase family 4 protein [Aliivibrio finisterrensis]RYU44038.1 glycosyltransferase family 1 protein [Aliivibrio finisterrensis]
MKKLLFIVNVDWFFISHRLPIALSALKQGFEVHIACALTDKREMLEKYGIIVHPLELSRSGVGLFSELKTLNSLYSIISSVQPDLTHCVTIKPVLYGNIIARFLKTSVRISSISGLGYVFIANGFKAKLFRFFISSLYKLALKNSQAVIFQNSSDRDVLKDLGALKEEQEVFIRGSGVDLNQYSVTREPADDMVVMLIARLLIDKGVNEFAQAAKIISSQRSDIRMVLVGDADLENPKSISPVQIRKWADTGILEHWGYSHDVVRTIAQSNIMVLPSYREGLPKSLVEAAACGRAVITTDVPGCRDAIEPNETGLLVPSKSTEELAEAIIKLADNEPLRHELASNGRKLAESEFDINNVVAKHIEIYTRK